MSTVVEPGLIEPPALSEIRQPLGKIRVLRLFSRLNIGGPAIHVILVTAGLDPQRYESRLVVGREGQREGNFFDLAYARNVSFRIIPSFVRRIHPFWDLITLVRLVRLMKNERPDIVHTHTAKAGALGRVAARFAGVPVVVHTFHGSVFQGYFDSFSSHVFQFIEKALVHWTDTIVGVSPRVAEEIARRKIAPRNKIAVVYLGLELDRFRNIGGFRGDLRRELGVPLGSPLIGCVGRLVPIKDISMLLRAMKQILSSNPDAVLLLVGDGSERQDLELETYQLGLDSRVRFLGFRRDLERIYADIDVAVNSSINEGTPVSLIEAMAAGVPVVATHVGGTPDLLGQGELGKLVPSGDSQALSDAILDVLHHRERAAEVAKGAQASVLARFRSERLIEDLDNLYVQLLTKKGIPVPEKRGTSRDEEHVAPIAS